MSRVPWSEYTMPAMVTDFAPLGAAAVAPAGTADRGAPMGCTAIFRGALPTAMVAVTVRFTRSTTDTSFEPSLATHAVRPSEAMATQCGVFPTGTAAASALLVISTMSSSPGPWAGERAQRPSGVGGAWWGETPTAIWATIWFVAVSRTWMALTPARVK